MSDAGRRGVRLLRADAPELDRKVSRVSGSEHAAIGRGNYAPLVDRHQPPGTRRDSFDGPACDPRQGHDPVGVDLATAERNEARGWYSRDDTGVQCDPGLVEQVDHRVPRGSAECLQRPPLRRMKVNS